MTPTDIAAWLEIAVKVIQTGAQFVQSEQATMNETDLAAIKVHLTAAQTATRAYRTEVDEALDAASRR